MSNPIAVATVTSALQHLLTQAVNSFPGGAQVTVRPPDKARLTPPGNQLNVFLYHTTVDAAWRNQDMPTIRPGETSFPPLPLVLHYVITAYGEGDEDDIKAHQLLGRAMSVLHDHPILGPDEFKDLVAGADLQNQVERVRMTAQALTVDDMYKLWTAFQTQYRISAAYEVSVVLIDSRQPGRTPLPVLTRGESDRGPVAQASIDAPFPSLEAATPPNRQLAALVGDKLTLTGRHLAGASGVRFTHLKASLPTQPTVPVTDTQIDVVAPAQLSAGVWTVSALFSTPGQPDRASNELPLAVAPRVTNLPPAPLARDAKGTVTVTLTCTPAVVPGQAVFLLLGDRQIPLDSTVVLPSGSLRFVVANAEPGTYFIRVRGDGVDSLLVDRRPAVPVFDPGQRVTII
jgi:Pvc16 N-terminal domain